ncbi:hypothetical protein H6783_01335 [Candidatus Nomurabacteria bacterium]|nr:hypothetical protein [Candidatus Nomurabacteria bacterium]
MIITAAATTAAATAATIIITAATAICVPSTRRRWWDISLGFLEKNVAGREVCIIGMIFADGITKHYAN